MYIEKYIYLMQLLVELEVESDYFLSGEKPEIAIVN